MERATKRALTYTAPALEWTDGLPVGNGTIGAMLWGDEGKETITLNHEALFREAIKKDLYCADLLPQVRQQMEEGNTKQAQDLFNARCRQSPEGCNAYQVFAVMQMQLSHEQAYSRYDRELCMDTGVARIQAQGRQHGYELSVFASSVDNLLVQRLCARDHHKMDVSFSCSRAVDEACRETVRYEKGVLKFDAQFTEKIAFAMRASIQTDGACEWKNGQIEVSGATYVEARYALAVQGEETRTAAQGCENTLAQAACFSWEELLQRSSKAHAAKFERVQLLLGQGGTQQSTQALYEAVCEGGQTDISLYSTLLDAARFYTLCTSLGCRYPMNLQGIWNDSIAPMWESGYTTDMNFQMHHWLMLPGNLAECYQPMFDWLRRLRPTMQKQAMQIFGCRGFYIPQYTDHLHTPTCWADYAMFQVLWSGSSAWIAQHYWEYWKYTQDEAFLHAELLPYLKGCAEFYLDFLCKDDSGTYDVRPSLSPENTTAEGNWLVTSSTIDLTLVREVLGNLIALDEQKQLCDPQRSSWEEILAHLREYPVDEQGVLQEWCGMEQPKDPYHRHLSHLYGLFPGKLFSPQKNFALYGAAVKALEKRIGGGFDSAASWSHAWYACCYARTGDGDKALACIDNLLRCGTLPNFLTTHNDWREQGLSNRMIGYKLIQIDALLGAAAAITEMLVQCENDVITIAPAMPERWKKAGGSVRGLRVYGNQSVDFSWSNGILQLVKIYGCTTQDYKIKYGMPYFGQE